MERYVLSHTFKFNLHTSKIKENTGSVCWKTQYWEYNRPKYKKPLSNRLKQKLESTTPKTNYTADQNEKI